VPESLLREIALQAAAGLEAIHAAGVVHRDVKPENLLLADDARLRISDLGVAKLAESGSTLTSEGHFVGTLAYASPEQCQGGPVGPASDLYALGVVLYELATGANPFASDGPWGALRAHLDRVPPPVHEVRPDFSSFLSGVVATLLAKDPAQRFASARALRAAVEEGEGGAWWERRLQRALSAGRPRVPVRCETALRGRAQDVADLEATFQDALAGRGRVVFLVGEAGLGKSRLAHELLQAHATQDVEVLYGAYRADRHGGALRDGLAGLFAGVEGSRRLAACLAETPDLVEPFGRYLRRDAVPTGGASFQPAARDALVLRLLERLADERPVIWVVEDVQHAPPDALRLLTALARGAASRRVLLVVTSREPLPEPFAEAWRRMAHVRRRDLHRLDREDVHDLVADVLRDEEAASRLGPKVATLADGVPLFALEIIQGLEASGALERAVDGRLVERRRVETIAVPSSLREAVLGRLRELRREEAEILDVAAVQGHTFVPDVIARVRGEPRIRVLEALGHIERRHGLVRSDGASVRFDHPLVHEVVYGAMPPALRAEVHRLVADALLAGAGSDEPAEIPGPTAHWVVHHLLRGSEPARAAPYLRAAVRHLEATHQREAVVDVARRAADVGSLPPEEREGMLRTLGRHLLHLGRMAASEAALREAVALSDASGDAAARARTRIALAFHHLASARYEGALEILDETEALLAAAADPALEAEALGGRGQAWWCLGRYDRARACHERALAVAREAHLPVFEARASSDLGVVCHELGYLEEAEALLRRALELQEALGDRTNRGATSSNLANVFHDQGRKAEALALYEGSLAFERTIANRAGEAVALVNLGTVWLDFGALAEADSAWRRCIAITREIGARRVEAFAHHGLGQLAASRGDREAARESLQRALRIRREIGTSQGVGDTLLALGALAFEAQDRERAVEQLREAAAVAREAGDENTGLMAAIYLAALGEGDPAEAEARFEAVRPRIRHDLAMEAHHVLWRATGDHHHLEAARALLERERAHAPAAYHESMIANVPLHRRVHEGRAD
jgi:tetratricopeptide (TPR) repeat protein